MDEPVDTAAPSANRVSTPVLLGLVVLGMFGFGFALVPLYNVFCDITGLNGKTGVVSSAEAAHYAVDESREISVQFITSLNANLGWQFSPVTHTMKVHPGKVYQALFFAKNTYDKPMVGQAVPSVMPATASRYFSKTECFCFTQQAFAAGEGRDLPVSFVIDPKLPNNITTITLSYTFFDISQTALVQ